MTKAYVCASTFTTPDHHSGGPGLYLATGRTLPHVFGQPCTVAVEELQCGNLGTCPTTSTWALSNFPQVSWLFDLCWKDGAEEYALTVVCVISKIRHVVEQCFPLQRPSYFSNPALAYSLSLWLSHLPVPHSGVMFVFGGYQEVAQSSLFMRLFPSRGPQGDTVRHYILKYY